MARQWSILRKQINYLFVTELKLDFNCTSFPMRSERGSSSVVRFYLKMNHETIWDFPRDFEVKKLSCYDWSENNGISNLVRNYIDCPVNELLTKVFGNEVKEYRQHDYFKAWEDQQDVVCITDYKITQLFIAGDRRIGKQKLLEWAKTKNNPKIDLILSKRFKSSPTLQVSNP